MTGDLSRFEKAQDPVWDQVTAELRAGRKTSHWMWFVFPQLAALGRSETARFYGIADLAEAQAYLAHPLLAERLETATRLMLTHRGGRLLDILGDPDHLKFRSCMTLFGAASEALSAGLSGRGFAPLAADALDAFPDGGADAKTLDLLQPNGWPNGGPNGGPDGGA